MKLRPYEIIFGEQVLMIIQADSNINARKHFSRQISVRLGETLLEAVSLNKKDLKENEND